MGKESNKSEESSPAPGWFPGTGGFSPTNFATTVSRQDRFLILAPPLPGDAFLESHRWVGA